MQCSAAEGVTCKTFSEAVTSSSGAEVGASDPREISNFVAVGRSVGLKPGFAVLVGLRVLGFLLGFLDVKIVGVLLGSSVGRTGVGSMVGGKYNHPAGCLEGVGVLSTEGSALGSSDGSEVGKLNGMVVGMSDGMALGTSDGFDVGPSVGVIVGTKLGLPDGTALGKL